MSDVLSTLVRPPCAELLGWRLVDPCDPDGWTLIAFEGRPEFTNPAGFIQGGFLTAMLDDTIGPAALQASGGALYTASIDLTVSFLAPAKPGPILGHGRALQLGKTIGFLEAFLTDEAGATLARATSSARLVPTEKVLTRETGEGDREAVEGATAST